MSNIPTQDIIEAFGGTSEPILLPGGEGRTYKVGNVIFKPVDDVQQDIWTAEVLEDIEEEGFRVSKPVKASDGSWVYKGWKAFKYQRGKEKKGNWNEKIAVSRKFHTVLMDIVKPDFIGKRSNPWEKADKSIWEGEFSFKPEIKQYTNRLISISKPIYLPEQVIHGDMTGNILFDVELDPLVIDFSPYWRPAEFATAVIIVDSIVWEGAPNSLVDEMNSTFNNNQLLIRAALWRIKTSDIFITNTDDLIKEISAYTNIIGLIESRVIN